MIFKKTVIRADEPEKFSMTRSCREIEGGEREFRHHMHSEFEIALIKSGGGIYNIRGKEYKFSQGDIFIISGNEPHCITYMNTDAVFHLMNVQFEPRFIWSSENSGSDVSLLKIFFERNEIFENRLNAENPATEEIRRLLREMEDEAENERHRYALMIKILLIKTLIVLSRSYDYVTNETDRFDISRQALAGIDRSMVYINSNLETALTLDEISREAGMNRSYFCTVFKRLNGISPWEYITIKRVEKAVGLLKTTDETMLEIAGRCGFNNTSNFNRSFKRVTGHIPKHYRKAESIGR